MPDVTPIGSMRWPVQYQARTEAASGYGQPKPVFTIIATFRALVRSPTGSEAMNASQMKATVSHVIEMRWPGYTLDPTGRLISGTQVFQIVYSVDPDGRRRRLNVHCTELVGQVV